MSVSRSILEDIKYAFSKGNALTRLMVINTALFVFVNLIFIGIWLTVHTDGLLARGILQDKLRYFCMSSDGWTLLRQPWSILSSMFLHANFGHFLGNIVALYLFGRIVVALIGERRVFPIYLIGGLFGNLMYFISAQLPFLFVDTYALGASAAVMALAGASLILAPDYRVMLFLLGEVKVKYIVLVMVLLDLVGIASQDNTGGHAGHIGGFVIGCAFVYQLRDGKDWSLPINNFLQKISSWFAGSKVMRGPKAKIQPMPKRPAPTAETLNYEDRLNAILDKIKAAGLESLSEEEKQFLYDAGKRNR
ncbi:MAG: rhomboid family intramembrane serine protease [Chitinophagales bacterium]|nr:rhomboid family intramembrane serine protease [Chitinophagales bacterium]